MEKRWGGSGRMGVGVKAGKGGDKDTFFRDSQPAAASLDALTPAGPPAGQRDGGGGDKAMRRTRRRR